MGTIQITVNGVPQEVSELATVADVLADIGFKPEQVLVELNGRLLDRADAGHKLKRGDRIILLPLIAGGMDVAPSVLDLIGNTPLVALRTTADEAEIWAKLEYMNPGGSVKDRIALAMVEEAERSGRLTPGATIIEPTSGNTGIGLAIVAAVRGYRLIVIMPETMSPERRAILTQLGAEVVLTPGEEGMAGAVRECERMRQKDPTMFCPSQFDNPANPEAHARTTAEEIWRQTGGLVDAFVAGIGTGGTITGVARVLRVRLSRVLIVGVEPAGSPVLSGGKPGRHMIQGIGAGFIPRVLDRQLLSEVVTVTDEEAIAAAGELARTEGLFVGISSGAAAVAARRIAQRLGRGKRVVTVFPDGGERYLSVEYRRCNC